jgi:hypothetical protein
VIARKFSMPGIKGELDLAAYDGSVLAFDGAKTRLNRGSLHPQTPSIWRNAATSRAWLVNLFARAVWKIRRGGLTYWLLKQPWDKNQLSACINLPSANTNHDPRS